MAGTKKYEMKNSLNAGTADKENMVAPTKANGDFSFDDDF